jgi:hypothetical protein
LKQTNKKNLKNHPAALVNHYEFWILAVITGLAVGLRLYKLGEWSLWGDEIITVNRALDIFHLSPSRYSVSLILTNFTLNWFGVEEWTARLVPAILGVITIPAIYFPTRKIFNPEVALLTGLFLAISPWHLYWSQNARFYTAILLFYTLALFAFYYGIERDRPWYLVLFLVLFGLAIQERLFALFLVPVVVGYLVLIKILSFEKPSGLNFRNVLILLLPGFAGALVVSWKFLRNPSSWLVKFGWVNNNPFWILSGVVYYVGIPILCMGLVGALLLLLEKNRAALLFSLAAVTPFISVLILSLVQYTANRYVFVSLISWIILASVAVRELFSRLQDNGRFLAIGVFLILFLFPLGENVLYYKYQHGNRDNWKAAYSFIRERIEPGDMIVTANRSLSNFYLQEEAIGMASLEKGDLDNIDQRVWFVEDMNVENKWSWIHRWVTERAQLVANFDNVVEARNFKMRVYLYEPVVP